MNWFGFMFALVAVYFLTKKQLPTPQRKLAAWFWLGVLLCSLVLILFS